MQTAYEANLFSLYLHKIAYKTVCEMVLRYTTPTKMSEPRRTNGR